MRLVAINENGKRIGEDHYNAKYSNHEIDQVNELKDSGLGYKRISKIMEMPIRTVRDIVSGKRRCQSNCGFKKCEA